MKTYVVNMEKDTQKRELITKQLKQHPELNWQVFKAVEGRKLSDQEQKEMILPEFFSRYGRNATLPAVGCSLSHIGIYKDMINTNTKFALILEDDAILSLDLKLDSITQILDVDAPVAVLLTPDFWYHKDANAINIDAKYKIYQLNAGVMTSGYAINLAAVKLLVPMIFPVRYTADAWSQFIKLGLELYGVVPHVISYPDGYGEIGLSQHMYKTLYEKLRFAAVIVYIKILNAKNYLIGNRKSLKKWR